MTAREIVSAALRKIGALASGETASAADANDGLSELNRMIGSWSTDGLLIYAKTADSLTLVAGTASYTMGTGGTFSTTRPQEILEALIRDSSNSDYPLTLRTLSEYASIGTKSSQSSLPTDLYEDGGYPLRTLTLYPVPSSAYTLIVYSLKPLTSVSTLDTTISLPPGYDDALIYNLAVRLAPEYGKTVSDVVSLMAVETKAGAKRSNERQAFLKVDSALVPRGYRSINIFTGGSS